MWDHSCNSGNSMQFWQMSSDFRPNQAEDVESADHLVGMLSSVFFWIGSHVAAMFTRISFIS